VGPGGPWWALVGPGGPWWALVGPGGPWWALVGPGGPWWALVMHRSSHRVISIRSDFFVSAVIPSFREDPDHSRLDQTRGATETSVCSILSYLESYRTK